MAKDSKISLIDLSSQFPFEVDDAIKKEICFGETLIISCGHYEGDIWSEESDSEWSCEDTQSEASVEVKDDKLLEIKDRLEEEAKPEEEKEQEDDFHFFFFPDCIEPLAAQHSNESILVVDGLPQINFVPKIKKMCTCLLDTKGRCDCYTKLPCNCGAKTTAECKCAKLDSICICNELKPTPVCMCKKGDVCVCFPGHPQPVCVCDQVEKPCICYEKAGKFPSPICPCKHKPDHSEKLDLWLDKFESIEEDGEQTFKEEEVVEEVISEGRNEEKSKSGAEGSQDRAITQSSKKSEKCMCQVVSKKPHCLCLTGQQCICTTIECICGVQNTCKCEPSPSQPHLCKSDESKIVCDCKHKPKECLCEGTNYECQCFPKNVCKCENPENCKCFVACDCTEPCICDVVVKEKCICLDKIGDDSFVCICEKDKEKCGDIKKLKKIRAGKDGYRWCRDVDPRHTYFDYAYDRSDKLDNNKDTCHEKITIQGLHEDKKLLDELPVHGIKEPSFKKKTHRKPSIDCCSSVGGISICVETLGEDKDKFLVQVVSHSSKEGAKSGTKLVSILDCNLHTMEENRTEHITKRNLTKERKTYIAICENGYYQKVTRTCGDKSVIKRHYHSFEDAKYFLLEGANIVLLRYFAIRRYRGNVKTETVMMNGSICESIYVCKGVSQAIVNGKSMFVAKVERHITEPTGLVHRTLSVLSLRGYMISHEWADHNYMFHINPLLNVIPERDEIEPHMPLRERWRDDMQLFSDYLDFKVGVQQSTRTSEGGRYVTESGALTGTIRDYLQAVLLLRPHDAIHFTRHYFGAALSTLDLPHDEYFDPTQKHVRYYYFEE